MPLHLADTINLPNQYVRVVFWQILYRKLAKTA